MGGDLSRRVRGAVVTTGALVAALALSACASDTEQEGFDVEFSEPQTRIDYDVRLEGAPGEQIASLMEQSLTLFRRQSEGAQSEAFLRRRGRQDIETAQRILRSFGYYEADVQVEVEPAGTVRATAQGTDGDGRPGTPATGTPQATAVVIIVPRRQFTLASQTLSFTNTGDDPPEPLDAAALGAPVGGPAEARPITEAERAAVSLLRTRGRPFAEFTGRDAVADLEEATLEVDSTIDTGRAYVFGPVTFSGAPNVDEEYLRTYLPFGEGEVFDTTQLAVFQRRLIDTDLFGSATVAPPEEAPPGEDLPVSVVLEEAPFRTVSAGLRFSTDTGPGVRFGFEHRNLFGSNEKLALNIDTELDQQAVGAAFSKPQFLRDGQFLDAEVETFNADESPFTGTGVNGTLGLRREIGERWEVGAGGLFEYADIDQQTGGSNTATIGGIPIFVAYDGTNDLLDATEGQRARLTMTPIAGTYAEDPTSFFRIEGRAATFHEVVSEGGLVMAARSRLGTIVGEDLEHVPETRRFYSGGGGSVRGYERYFVGPIGPRNQPTGGLSVAEVSVEARARIYGDFGGVVFVDGGTVSAQGGFDFDYEFLVASGLGLRYYSPVGPIRLDVAFPLNPRPIDDSFQVYFSIGQAF